MNDYGFLSLVPAAAALTMAFALKRVAVALFCGVLLGSVILRGHDPVMVPVHLLTTVWAAFTDGGHLWMLSFALLLGGLMGLLRVSGSQHALGLRIAHLARSRRGGQLVAWGLGLLLFFDDYANTLFVGSSMSPAARRLRISREKLAFIVDATAAPVASLAPLSSWIAIELGYIADQLATIHVDADAYAVFLSTIPLRFYPLLMLVFGLIIAVTNRDFGPMASAEHAAHLAPEEPVEDLGVESPTSRVQESQRSRLMIPAAVGIVAFFAVLVWTGRQGALANGMQVSAQSVLQFASSSKSLVAATLMTGLSTLAGVVAEGSMPPLQALKAWSEGARAMLEVTLILLFAWSLGSICSELNTARYLVGVLGDGFAPGWLPATVFCVSAAMSFATGTSWGTMGIVFPLAVPLAHELHAGDQALLLGTIASVLSGSVFGDHCSPISDTTIMSALATGCDQLAHVQTQIPYALVVAAVSVVCCSVPVAFGLIGVWPSLLLGSVVLVLVVRGFGRVPSEQAPL